MVNFDFLSVWGPKKNLLCGRQENKETDETSKETLEVVRVDLTEQVEPKNTEMKKKNFIFYAAPRFYLMWLDICLADSVMFTI